MSRANEESKTKSIRVSASRQTRRNNLGNGDIMTAKCPGWLRVVNRNIVGSSATGGTFEIIPERKEVVKRIFELAKNGMGKNGIAKLLNSEKVPVFGNSKIGWQHLYIFQTLHNPAVIGEYQPHKNYIVDNEGSKVKKRIPIGDVVKNYYPPIISEETFYLIKSRTVKNVSASKGDSLNNLFSGFAYCKKCGAPLHYVSKNKNTGEIYLVCSRARAGAGCEYKSIRYQYVENEVLHLIHELKSSDILSDGSEEKALREKHISLDEQSKTIDSRIDNFIDAIADEADKRIVIGLKGKITVLENEKEAIKDKLKSLKQVPSSTPNKLPEFHSLIELLKSDKSVILRHKIRASLMDMVTRIEIDTEEKEIEIHFPGNISRGIRPDHESGGLDVVWYGGEHSVNRL